MLAPGSGLGLYGAELQPGLLRETDAFYDADAQRAMAALDVPQYLAYAQAALRAEADRVHACLDAGASLGPALAIVEARVVAAHVPALLERGFAPLLDGCRGEDLGRLYTLLARVGRTEDLRRAFADRTRARFSELVAPGDEEKDRRLVAAVLEYKAAADALVAGAFRGDDTFVAALKSALEAGVNSRESRPAELLGASRGGSGGGVGWGGGRG